MITELKDHKAPGPDTICNRLLKTLAPQAALVLGTLFKGSLKQWVLPDNLCYACVAPVFKKGDTADSLNYRPISLTCIVCKLMKHTHHYQPNQCPPRSPPDTCGLAAWLQNEAACETQLILLTQDFGHTIDSGSRTVLILLNFSKAFDKLYH